VSLLDAEEKKRAERYRVDVARKRYVAARAITRLLVARCANVEPSALIFATGARGKPRLEFPKPTPAVWFNTAHSGDTAVVALATAELGVDVESLRPVPNLGRLAQRFFSHGEREQLSARPESARDAAFLTLWTCKEAYLKAVGSGIAMPLRRVEIDLDRNRLARINNDPHAASVWTLLGAGLPEPAVCTVAIRGSGWSLITREFEWHTARDFVTP
jgi:4'-phosphopantetheinyl transferase